MLRGHVSEEPGGRGRGNSRELNYLMNMDLFVLASLTQGYTVSLPLRFPIYTYSFYAKRSINKINR